MRRAAAGVVLVLAILGASSARAGSGEAVTRVLMKKADRLYAERGAGKAPAAVAAYEKVLAVEADNVAARWKIARALYWIGAHTSDSGTKLRSFETGIRYCQEAVKLDPSCGPCHFWLGTSYGAYGQAKGMMAALGLVPHLRAAMEEVLKIDPRVENGGADLVLGRLYYELPAVKGGDNRKAIEHLRRATRIGPRCLINHVYLAEALLAEGEKQEAHKELRFVVDLAEADFLPEEIPESKEQQAAARRLLRKHFGE